MSYNADIFNKIKASLENARDVMQLISIDDDIPF